MSSPVTEPFSLLSINAVMNLVAFRASSIAAASILAAQDEGLTQKSLKSKMNSVSWMRSLNSVCHSS